MGEDQRSLQENWTYQGNISRKDGLNKGQTYHGPYRSRRRGSKNSQKNLYKSSLNGPDIHDGMVSHLEPEILECEEKRAIGSITTNKANGDDTF